MFLHQALQDFKKQSDYVKYWIKQIHKFLKSKHYGVKSYNTLCQELHQVWPIDSLAKLEYLPDCTVKKISFAPVYYALSFRRKTGFEAVNDTMIKYGDKIVEGSWFESLNYRGDSNYSPGVVFLKNNEDIFWYFTDVVSIDYILFYVLAQYWQTFDTISQDNIDKFAKYRKYQNTITHKQSLGNRGLYFWCLQSAEDEKERVMQAIEAPKNVPMCKILQDCLQWSTKNFRFFIRTNYERE